MTILNNIFNELDPSNQIVGNWYNITKPTHIQLIIKHGSNEELIKKKNVMVETIRNICVMVCVKYRITFK